MKYWKTEHKGNEIRVEWNESATFNLQTPIGGQWVDYECFTCYGIKNETDAMLYALEYLLQSEMEDSE
jgi:hypothetical protein